MQIIRRGTLLNNGQNFAESRVKNLENLQEFVPPHVSAYLQNARTVSGKKSSRNSLIGQAAFIKYAFRNDGGHLSTQNLSYIRIPKAANTSLSYAMLSKKYPGLKEKKPNEFQINFLADVNLLPAMKAKTDTIFTVVRNPFARLVSVYRDFFETNHTPFIYSTYLFGILKQEISFSEFVSRISRIPDRLKDQHFKPQHCFFKPYEDRGFAIESFKLEETANLENFLKKHGIELTHRNKSNAPYDYTRYYNSGLLQQVNTIYQKDIEKFGYQEVYETLKEQLKK